MTNPFRDQLFAHGIPEELHPMFSRYGLGTLSEKLGINFVSLSAEEVVATMPVEGNTQPAGLLHGGAHLVLAETLGSIAAALHAGPERFPVGIDINATHHRGVSSGIVTGVATALSLGNTLTSHEVVMRDEEGRRLSTARITNLLRDRSKLNN